MKKRNIVIMIIAILIIFLILLLLFVPNKHTNIIYNVFLKEKMTEYVNNIEYDIKIDYYDLSFKAAGGFATTYHYYLINTIEKKVYKIDDYYAFQQEHSDKLLDKLQKGHHYDVEVKNITQAKLDEFLKYIDSISDESNDLSYWDERWEISYESEKIIVKEFDISLIY